MFEGIYLPPELWGKPVYGEIYSEEYHPQLPTGLGEYTTEELEAEIEWRKNVQGRN